MLRHIVIFKFKESSSSDATAHIISEFLKLKHKIENLIDIEWGKNISPENHHQGFTDCFILTFKSLEHLNAYQNHSAHLNFQTILKPHFEKVFVVDYKI